MCLCPCLCDRYEPPIDLEAALKFGEHVSSPSGGGSSDPRAATPPAPSDLTPHKPHIGRSRWARRAPGRVRGQFKRAASFPVRRGKPTPPTVQVAFGPNTQQQPGQGNIFDKAPADSTPRSNGLMLPQLAVPVPVLVPVPIARCVVWIRVR